MASADPFKQRLAADRVGCFVGVRFRKSGRKPTLNERGLLSTECLYGGIQN